jgi:UDP-N-acetylglucosamine 2-epimerase (non-hydrolysing)
MSSAWNLCKELQGAGIKNSITKIVVVVSARPNFVKVAPLLAASQRARTNRPGLKIKLVHTGQHYDEQMSQAFFDELALPRPDVELGIGSGSQAEQTGKVMIAFERLLIDDRPDWVVVVGDVNSTLACALAAKKLGVRVAHIEAGLRSRDWTMPEEINRVVTDVLSDALFTTDRIADANLRAEGIDPARIQFVGNLMIDTLLKHRKHALALEFWKHLGLDAGKYAVLTLHRPSNVDNLEAFTDICSALEQIQKDLSIVFPVHPRTRKMAIGFGLWYAMQKWPKVQILEPLGYLEMLSMTSNAALILTDSGGLQDEALVLGVPCITLRDNTERPITLEVGGNRLVGNRAEAIIAAVKSDSGKRVGQIDWPEKWDGVAADRVVSILLGEN